MIRNTSSSWGALARLFHWVLGITIIGMIAYGWWMNHFPARPDRFFYRSIHADIGYAVLLLMVLRLVWRGLRERVCRSRTVLAAAETARPDSSPPLPRRFESFQSAARL